MKYWTDECDTWAALSLKELAKEQKAQKLIGDYDFDPNCWQEVSCFSMAWICDLAEACKARKSGKLKFIIAKIKWYRPLWWIFMFYKSPSKTNRAWLICSAEE